MFPYGRSCSLIEGLQFLTTSKLIRVEQALEALTAAAKSTGRDQNLLELAVEAAQHRCTLGEISDALEKAWGRHVATSQVISGAYR